MNEEGYRTGMQWFDSAISDYKGINNGKEGWWNAPNKVNVSGLSKSIFPYARGWDGVHSVDLWYIINQWEPTWPKHWKDYLDDMLNLYKDENLERFLPVKEA